MISMLAQIDPKTAEVAVVHVEKQPWVAVVVCLAGICLTMVVGLVWIMRSVGPWIERREKSAQDHISGLLAARGKESERDLQQVTEQIGLKLENRIERVGDSIANVRQDLARIAAKIGVAGVILILLLLTGSITFAQVQRRAQVRAVELAKAGELARAGDAASTKGGPYKGRPCTPVCIRPSVCEDGRCTAATRKPTPPKPGPHSAAELPAWADASTSDRPGDSLLTARAAETALWAPL